MELSDKDRVRKDLSSYERNKKLHSLSNLALAASLTGTGVGAWKGSKALIGAGLGASFTSGFARGKAKNKERSALNRVKKYYDLREKSAGLTGLPQGSLIWGPATAALSLAADIGLTAAGFPPGTGAKAALTVAPSLAAGMGDYLSIGRISDSAKKSISTITAATLKRGLGKTLTEAEEIAFNVGHAANIKNMAFEKRPDGIAKKLLKHWNIGTVAAPAAGYSFGENLLPAFKIINKVDPKLTDELIHAASTNDMKKLHGIYKKTLSEYTPATTAVTSELKGALSHFPSLNKELKASGETLDSLIKKTVKSKGRNIEGVAKRVNISAKNLAESGKNIDTAISNIPGATVAKKLLGKGSGQIIGETISSNAGNIKNLSEIILEKSKRVRPAMGAIGAAGALALIGSMLGKHRSKHPLAKDENIIQLLPAIQAKKEAV